MTLYTPAFFALYFANLAIVASFSAFFMFPLYLTANGGNNQDIGLIMGAFACASALSRPLVSSMVDRIGRKISYILGSLVMSLMPLVHLLCLGPLEQFYLPLLLIRMIHGIGLSIYFTAVFTFVVDLIPVQRLNEGIGIFGTSGLTGMAMGPAVGEFVIRHYGFNHFFITAAVIAVVGLLLQLPVKDQHARQNLSDAPSPSFFAVLKTRKQLICAGLALVFGIGLAASGNFIAPFAAARQLSFISLYYLAYSMAAILVRFVVGRLADRIGENQIIPWGLGIAAGALFIVPLTHTNSFLLLVGFAFGIAHGLLFPALNAMAVRHEPYHVRGKVTGIFTGGIDSGAFLGAVFLGIIGQKSGFTLLFTAAGAIMLTGFCVFRLRPRN